MRIRFTCQRSGNCCSIPGGFVRVTEAEAVAIAAFLGLSPEGFRSRYLDGDRLIEGSSSACIFLASGRPSSCSIYEARPAKCATFPYWPELTENEAALRRAAALCPGLSVDEQPGST